MATRILFKNLLKTVVFVRLQIISYYIRGHSAGPSEIGAVSGEWSPKKIVGTTWAQRAKQRDFYYSRT